MAALLGATGKPTSNPQLKFHLPSDLQKRAGPEDWLAVNFEKIVALDGFAVFLAVKDDSKPLGALLKGDNLATTIVKIESAFEADEFNSISNAKIGIACRGA